MGGGVRKTKKKIILSTGMCNLSEIQNSVKNILKYNATKPFIVVFHELLEFFSQPI